jgi:hypothetical protein
LEPRELTLQYTANHWLRLLEPFPLIFAIPLFSWQELGSTIPFADPGTYSVSEILFFALALFLIFNTLVFFLTEHARGVQMDVNEVVVSRPFGGMLRIPLEKVDLQENTVCFSNKIRLLLDELSNSDELHTLLSPYASQGEEEQLSWLKRLVKSRWIYFFILFFILAAIALLLLIGFLDGGTAPDWRGWLNHRNVETITWFGILAALLCNKVIKVVRYLSPGRETT